VSGNGEAFLARWARLKRAGDAAARSPAALAVPAAPVVPALPKAPLPDPERLGFDDDFTAFLGREVEEQVKRAAMKKLFHSPHFNVMDGLDIYIDDYTIPSPLDETTLRSLAHARDMLFDGQPEVVAEEAASSGIPDIPDSAVAPAIDVARAAPVSETKAGATHDA
jgi:hypothetical protein